MTTQLTTELAETICGYVSLGKTLQDVAEMDKMPTLLTMYKWLNTYPEFKEAYNEARKLRAHSRFDKISKVTDMILNNEVKPEVGKTVGDLMKWQCSKDDNENYGDKVTQKHTGADGKGIEFVFKSILGELAPSNDVKMITQEPLSVTYEER